MHKTELRTRNGIFCKAHLHTGEPVWLVRSRENVWRVTSVPLSTGRVHYGDIVRLKVDANGVKTIDTIEDHAGYSAALILMREDGTFPNDFIAQADGFIPWERIDHSRIAVTLTEDTRKKACDMIDAAHLRVFRLARI